MSLTSLLNSFNDSMKDFNKKLRQTNEVTRATSALKQHAYAERCVLESALKLAKMDVETQELRKDPAFREIHDNILTRIPSNRTCRNTTPARPSTSSARRRTRARS